MKQNVNYNNGHNFNMQFDFCPKCKYFSSCYSLNINGSGNLPSYLGEECFDVYNQVLIEIRDFIDLKNNSSIIYPWAKQPERITESDYDKIEEQYMEVGGDDINMLYQSINAVLGANPAL